MTANFTNQRKEEDTHVQEAQRVPNSVNPKRPTPRHITIKMQKVKDKEKVFQAARETLHTRELL